MTMKSCRETRKAPADQEIPGALQGLADKYRIACRPNLDEGEFIFYPQTWVQSCDLREDLYELLAHMDSMIRFSPSSLTVTVVITSPEWLELWSMTKGKEVEAHESAQREP